MPAIPTREFRRSKGPHPWPGTTPPGAPVGPRRRYPSAIKRGTGTPVTGATAPRPPTGPAPTVPAPPTTPPGCRRASAFTTSSRGAPSPLDHDVLQLGVMLDGVHRHVLAEARRLEAAVGH